MELERKCVHQPWPGSEAPGTPRKGLGERLGWGTCGCLGSVTTRRGCRSPFPTPPMWLSLGGVSFYTKPAAVV